MGVQLQRDRDATGACGALVCGQAAENRWAVSRSEAPMLSVKNVPITKIILYLVVAFVVVSIWKDPAGSAGSAGDFLSSLGRFFHTLGSKTSTFFKNL
jgi:hypothetical protein